MLFWEFLTTTENWCAEDLKGIWLSERDRAIFTFGFCDPLRNVPESGNWGWHLWTYTYFQRCYLHSRRRGNKHHPPPLLASSLCARPSCGLTPDRASLRCKTCTQDHSEQWNFMFAEWINYVSIIDDFYRLQCRGSCLALPVFVSPARTLVGTCLIIELSELTKKLLFLMLSFFVSSQRNVQLHSLGSIRRPCLRAQHPLVFHGELSLPRGLKGGKASYNDQHDHISNTSVICWILGSPQRVKFFLSICQRKSISEFPGLSLTLIYWTNLPRETVSRRDFFQVI